MGEKIEGVLQEGILDIYEKCNADSGCRDRWERWSSHRERVQQEIEGLLGDMEKKTVDSVLVLGAGRCEDLDLKALLRICRCLTLADYDGDAVKRALERTELTEEEKHRIKIAGGLDFTGFYSAENRRRIEKTLREGQLETELRETVLELGCKAESPLLTRLGEGKYDMVIAGALHSQLIIPYTGLGNDGEEKQRLMGIAGELAQVLGSGMNATILKLVKPGGAIFVYFDVLEFSERLDNLQYAGVGNLIMGDEETQEHMIQELIRGFGGVAGGRSSYENLKERLVQRGEKASRGRWIWEYRQNKKYLIESLGIVTSSD